ncbi:MAG: FAD/NAD(P)-binding protein [Deltaproteobacteria bacterium]|nr:FAD/NAD(P)-binding protein [Deltaproteobacteria bacterium]MBI3294257.1 FAD/NAD(P)-binding protein [Deltaproteobacteria bacterium]
MELVDPMCPLPFRVQKVSWENSDVVTLDLVPESSSTPTKFQPGQFSMLYAFGVGEVPISHSGSPTEPSRVTHTIRTVGAVTNAIGKLKRGDTLGLRGPYGTAWPLKEAQGKDIVVGAGGLGMAPLRPILYSIAQEREKFGKVALVYGARDPKDFLFKDEWEVWKKNDIEIHMVVGQSTSDWKGHVGHITTLIPRLKLEPEKTCAFLCGSEIMMRFTAFELEKRGVSKSHISISLERNMKCAIGFCGHCQYGPHFICKDGPVFAFDRIEELMRIREL